MRNTFAISLGLVFFGAVAALQAGPPLICHPYNIGDAKSLPWGSGTSWDNPEPSYNIKNLSSDTLALLNESTPVLVRMETMRRVVLYGSIDHAAARSVLAELAKREQLSKPTPLAYFDYGYFLESLKQIEWKYKEDLTAGQNGYQYIQKALAMNPDSPEMHFAAAVAASSPPRSSERAEHLKKARAAKTDQLLAQNIATHF